jgi:hypothetical protein
MASTASDTHGPECRWDQPNKWDCDCADTTAEGTIDISGHEELNFYLNVESLFDECMDVLFKKHQDYSSLNISASPFGVMEGLLTRMWDKFARAVNLVENGTEANYESLEDTFKDMANYSMIAALCLRGHWPGVAEAGVKE